VTSVLTSENIVIEPFAHSLEASATGHYSFVPDISKGSRIGVLSSTFIDPFVSNRAGAILESIHRTGGVTTLQNQTPHGFYTYEESPEL
jgi:hypothetical protein